MKTCEVPMRAVWDSSRVPKKQPQRFRRSPAQRVRGKEAARHHTVGSAGRVHLPTVRAGDVVALPCAEARLPALGQA